MAKQLFGNNASALLVASISDSDLTIQVQNGFGALFPNPGADEYFLVTIENDSGDIEVVKVTTRACHRSAPEPRSSRRLRYPAEGHRRSRPPASACQCR